MFLIPINTSRDTRAEHG